MKNINNLCLGCMNELPEGGGVCPVCGWTKESRNEAHELEPGSILAGKYMVGRALGQGGFGITYLAWDLPGERKLAIKEYYPGSLSARQLDRYTVSPFTGSGSADIFAKGRTRFCNEAKNLAQFAGVPGIVTAYDFFEENGTAYIVMEFLEGRTLKDELVSRPGPMSMEETLTILKPVAAALEAVHAAGLIHRDISPDNIMLTPTGAKLLDFGAARAFSLSGERSNTINVKMGYAPAEQYNVHGQQGAWTDVYALAATVYRCVTGRVPEQSYERTPVDYLTRPSALNRSITPQQERVILTGMAVDYKNRYQTVRELMEALKDPLSAPWYATNTDKFVGGDAKTVAIDDPPDVTANIPAPPPAPVGKRGLAITALILSVLGSLIAISGFVLMIGEDTEFPGSAWSYAVLQVCAICCTWQTLASACAQLKGGPRRGWGKITAASFLLSFLIPVAVVLFGSRVEGRSRSICGVMDYDPFYLTFVLIFILMQLAAGVLTYGSPFPASPNCLVPRRKLIGAFCVSIAGMVVAMLVLVFWMPEFYWYIDDEWYWYYSLAEGPWYTCLLLLLAAIAAAFPALRAALRQMGGGPKEKWPAAQLISTALGALLALLMVIFIGGGYVSEDVWPVLISVFFFTVAQFITGVTLYGPLTKNNIALKKS